MPGRAIRDLVAAAWQMDETMVSAFTAAWSFQRLDLSLVNPGTVQTTLVNGRDCGRRYRGRMVGW